MALFGLQNHLLLLLSFLSKSKIIIFDYARIIGLSIILQSKSNIYYLLSIIIKLIGLNKKVYLTGFYQCLLSNEN